MGIIRYPTEGAGGRSEGEPRRKGAPIAQRGAVRECIAMNGVLIRKGIRRNVMMKGASLTRFDGEAVAATVGASCSTFCTVLRKAAGRTEAAGICGLHREIQRAHLRIIRRATQCTGRRSKLTTSATHRRSKRRPIRQAVTGILVGKGIRRHLHAERHILRHHLIG